MSKNITEMPAYEIKSFGMFNVRSLDFEGKDLDILITEFHFERGTVPVEACTHGLVDKYALQAIINALQQKCDSLDDAPTPVIWPAPKPEVK